MQPPMQLASRYHTAIRRLTLGVALAMSIYHLYVGFFGTPDAFTLRSTHVGFALVLCFLTLPLRAADQGKGPRPWDWALIALSLAATAYPVLSTDYIYNRFIYVDDLRTVYIVLAKPALVMEHGGGERLKLNSREYLRLRQWLEDGAPEP